MRHPCRLFDFQHQVQILFPHTQLKRSGLSEDNLLTFYKSIIHSKLEYAAATFATLLNEHQKRDLESLQKPSLRIIFPHKTYNESLDSSKLETLYQRRMNLAKNFFCNIKEENSKIHHLLPQMKSNNQHNLRTQKELPLPQCKTNRFKNSLIPYGLFNFQ